MATPVAAEEMKTPLVSRARIDWNAAAASLASPALATAAATFARLNVAAEAGFPGISNSTVPVLLPFDIDGFAKELTAHQDQSPDKMAESADRFMRSGFQATKFFLTGPAGFDAAFGLTLASVPDLSDIRYSEPVYVLLSGLGVTYQLDGPALPVGELVKSLQSDFPGIRRYLHESYIRYSFERYGVTYVAAIYCRDTRPRPKLLTCRQADRVMDRF